MISRGLIIACYSIVLLEWLLDDRFILVRYLHFAYLGFYLAITAFFVYLSLRQPRLSFWLLPAVLWVSIHYIQPFVNPAQPASPAEASSLQLTVLSFSVNSKNRHYQETAQLLKTHPADIVCLQEVPFQRYPQLLQALQAAGVHYQHVYSKKKSLMLLSRYPITPNKTMPFLQATVTIGAHILRVWTIHAPKSLRRKHYQHFYFDKLKQDIERDHTPLKLLCGDFNSTPHNDILPRFADLFNSAYQYRTQPALFTYPTDKAVFHFPIPLIKIDYILLSKQFRIDHYARLAQYAQSDHYPVMARVSLFNR